MAMVSAPVAAGSFERADAVEPPYRRSVRPGFKKLVLIYLWLAIASGCIVYVEPAPYDALLMGAVFLLPLSGLIALPRAISIYVLCWFGIVAGGYVAATQAGLLDVPIKHNNITLYLAFSSVVLAAFVAKDPLRHTRLIMSAYVAAALVASVAALIGYFNLVPGLTGVLTEFGRARGTFKDPNVFGAFVVPALLYSLNAALNARARSQLVWGAIVAVLLLGTLLSFSRGAWLNLGVGLIAYGFLAFSVSQTHRKRIRLAFLGVCSTVLALGALAAIQTVPQIAERLEQRASFEQSYDLGPEGRFGGQKKAAELVASHPLGIGALEFARVYHPEDAHQVYLSMYLNSGWFGGTLYLFLVLATVVVGLRLVLRDRISGGVSIAVFAGFLGMAIEGLIVDTDHWRHFFLIMAVLWGMGAARTGSPKEH